MTLKLAALGAAVAPLAIGSGARTQGNPTRPNNGVVHRARAQSEAVGHFGPTGEHWPTRTPRPHEPFDRHVEVDADWGAITDAISLAAQHPGERARIAVRPGSLGGHGSGANDAPVIANLGALGRSSRIVVVPRDGIDTVRFTNSIRILNVRGVTFLGFSPFPHSLNLSGVQDFAWARSKVLSLNITGRGAFVENVELVECVTPEAGLRNHDTWAFRTIEHGYRNISVVGCYLAPSYKEAGSPEHVDTLQLSGGLPQQNVTIRDTVIFASTNAGLIPSPQADNVRLERSLVVGGDRMLERYPLPSDANNFTSGPPISVNGAGTTNILSAHDSIIIGAVEGLWASVHNTLTDSVPRATSSQGAFSVRPELASIDSAWLNTRAPLPSEDFLRRAWDDVDLTSVAYGIL